MKLLIGAAAAIAAATLSAGIATPVSASDPSKPVVVTGHNDNIVTRRVSYADLNLIEQKAQKTLYRRVGYAVGDVCDEAVGPAATSWEDTSCRRDAWRGARPQITRAIDRARDMALYGKSNIEMAAITIRLGN